MNLNAVLIGSEDPKRLNDYYTKIFGKPSMEDSGYAGWKLGDGWFTVRPHSEIKGKNPQPGRMLLNIESADVKGDFAKLAAGGDGRAGSLPDGRLATEHLGRNTRRPR